MCPGQDDVGITNQQYVLRVLLDRWVKEKDGRQRPTSESITDSSYENSCFVENEIPLEELQALFPNRKIARISVRIIRESGFIIERRPDEAPENCSNPQSHVVVGPATEIRRNLYEKAAREIVKHETIEIIACNLGQTPAS